uniref:Synaptobrevin, longin-like domain protein n=1 Tax=Tanacetum cinerariifolium TaxID=118510 RepID=A0A699JFT6_TANCI|nr:hypothetical protein [Tanacetum cinerariifolium]
MPKATTTDVSLTKSYIVKVSKILSISPIIAQFYKPIENCNIHEGGHRDRLLACLAHMLYCVVAEEQYNLAYFFVKRIKCAKATSTTNLPYSMFLTHLYRYVMETYRHLDNGTYDIVERVMRPLALRQTRRPRSDWGKARRSVFSSSSHHQGTSSHLYDDDDDDIKTSRASTPSPTTYLNSLNPLDYQNYQMPSSSKQTDETLFARQTTLLNQTQRMHEEMREGFKSFGKALNGEAAKFVGDFKSLANEADASLAKHKALELEIKRLLKAVVNQDIMIIGQKESVVDISDLQTELERTKERFENCIIKKETEYAKL